MSACSSRYFCLAENVACETHFLHSSAIAAFYETIGVTMSRLSAIQSCFPARILICPEIRISPELCSRFFPTRQPTRCWFPPFLCLYIHATIVLSFSFLPTTSSCLYPLGIAYSPEVLSLPAWVLCSKVTGSLIIILSYTLPESIILYNSR